MAAAPAAGFDVKRLRYEYEALEALKDAGVYGCRGRPEKPDNSVWDCTVVGTRGRERTYRCPNTNLEEITASPYEDELLRLKLIFPPGYPKFPPRGYFVEDVYHPAVGEDGLIGLKILDGPPSAVRKEVGGKNVGTWGMGIEWVETMTVARILTTIQNMLEDPDDKDSDCVVLNEEAHREAHYNHNLFDEKMKKLKDKYDNYNELSHYDGGYNDDAKAARYKEKVWKDHSADNIDKELMPRKQKMIDEDGNAVM